MKQLRHYYNSPLFLRALNVRKNTCHPEIGAKWQRNCVQFDLPTAAFMAAAVNKRFVLLFYSRQRRKKRRKYLTIYWVREISQNRFKFW